MKTSTKVVIGTVSAFVVLGVIASAVGANSKKSTPTTTTASVTTVAPTTTQAAVTTTTAKKGPTTTQAPTTTTPPPTTAPAPVETVSETQAVTAAHGYLNLGTGFSQVGLIGQLDSPDGDGFSVADATYAVDSLNVDWNAQAVLSAQGYMALGTGFSQASMIQQLDSSAGDGYTYAQALYGANAVGL